MLSESIGESTADAATLAKTKLIGRVLANTALTASQRIEQATEISAKYNPRHLGPMKYDECDMFITILEGAVDLMSLLLQENPLSQLSVAEPKQDDQESPAPQAALNSPLESPLSEAAPNSLLDGASPSSPLGGSTQGSPVSQAQAGPCSEAASDSPSSEDVRSRPALPLNQAQTPACLTSTSLTPTAPTPAPAPSSPVSPADTPPMPAKAANTNLDASTMVVQQPLGKHVQLGHLHEDAPGLVTCNWQTPPAATWKQISTMAVRAVDALQFVLQQRAIDNTQVTATAADGCETKLVQLLLQLLQGHFSDVTLDFQPILHGGISPIVRLLDGHGGGGREGDPSMTLVTLCLERMTLDAVQGRLQEDSDGLVCAQQLCSMLAMLGKLTGVPCPGKGGRGGGVAGGALGLILRHSF